MKRYSLYVWMVATAVAFLSCKKEDKLDTSHFQGKWSERAEDGVAMDGSVTYTFNSDNTCSKHIYNALSNQDTTLKWTYVLSHDRTLVTMYGTDKVYTEQYRIKKLTSREMKWENASPGDGNSNKRLIR